MTLVIVRRSCEAFRNYYIFGAGFNWETEDWDKFNTWINLDKLQAGQQVAFLNCVS